MGHAEIPGQHFHSLVNVIHKIFRLCLSLTMNQSPPAAARASQFCSYRLPLLVRETAVLGSGPHRRGESRRQLKFVVSAYHFEPFSVNIDLDSKTTRSHDLSQLPWIGPVPGDIAEVEAYCRIFRAAEQLHIALMDALCNPLSGECTVSYDFTPEEKPLLEDKLLSVLGCMVALLNKGREEVLSGRSSSMNSFHVADLMEDKLPPLAIFRSEMKRCCESLHVALESYLIPDNERSWDLWTKLQRLKNICYDSGFPRGTDHPCHMLFANWNPVFLSTSKNGIAASRDSEVAFSSGGQVTVEGLKWLLEHGYKTIVDLRAETIKDIFYEAAINDANLSGKIDLVRLPIEVGNVPSADQVEKFASLVSDSGKAHIYLHSKEGVWRTSAMVSRWRQYMTHRALHFISKQENTSNKIILSPDIIGMGHVSSSINKASFPQDGSESVEESSSTLGRSNNVNQEQLYLAIDGKNRSSNEPYNTTVSCENIASGKVVNENEVGPLINFWREIDPLKAQLPPCDFFSKKEMSRFFKSKKISPSTYFGYLWKRLERLAVSQDTNSTEVQRQEIDGSNPVLSSMKAGSLNGLFHGKKASGSLQLPVSNKNFLGGDDSVPFGPTVNRSVMGERYSTMKHNFYNGVGNSGKKITLKTSREDQKCKGEASAKSGADDLGLVEGNMCASTTGVVRVQSRKKAEMFLVRTDGFSCTREKVTESSLAFSHPSTQQQMLMWKSTPKTVLLLKKLGAELMEEAKEVASFLYYQEKMNILVEPDAHDIFARIPGFGFVQTFYVQDTSDLHERVDFVACLGGDGVILHASNLFRGAVPPVVSFNLGSLGFLTSHAFEDFKQDLRQVIHGNNTLDGVYITLRMRLQCEIFRNGKAMPGKIFDVLNEVVVDRGSNPYLSKIECYEHDRLITKVQGDGVIVATPTGSTAYSTAAGGSMVHPNVPCMLFTPICPHSLSFRPVILPDSAQLELKIPKDARSNAWVSFDGKRRQQLSRGDSIRIAMSQHPLPTVNKFDQTGDWFHSLIRCLNWNERLDQKAF